MAVTLKISFVVEEETKMRRPSRVKLASADSHHSAQP
jgi:hypothetical protein